MKWITLLLAFGFVFISCINDDGNVISPGTKDKSNSFVQPEYKGNISNIASSKGVLKLDQVNDSALDLKSLAIAVNEKEEPILVHVPSKILESHPKISTYSTAIYLVRLPFMFFGPEKINFDLVDSLGSGTNQFESLVNLIGSLASQNKSFLESDSIFSITKSIIAKVLEKSSGGTGIILKKKSALAIGSIPKFSKLSDILQVEGKPSGSAISISNLGHIQFFIENYVEGSVLESIYIERRTTSYFEDSPPTNGLLKYSAGKANTLKVSQNIKSDSYHFGIFITDVIQGVLTGLSWKSTKASEAFIYSLAASVSSEDVIRKIKSGEAKVAFDLAMNTIVTQLASSKNQELLVELAKNGLEENAAKIFAKNVVAIFKAFDIAFFIGDRWSFYADLVKHINTIDEVSFCVVDNVVVECAPLPGKYQFRRDFGNWYRIITMNFDPSGQLNITSADYDSDGSNEVCNGTGKWSYSAETITMSFSLACADLKTERVEKYKIINVAENEITLNKIYFEIDGVDEGIDPSDLNLKWKKL